MFERATRRTATGSQRQTDLYGGYLLSIIPVLAFFHVIIGIELPRYFGLSLVPGARVENILFWVLLTATTIFLALCNRSRFRREFLAAPQFKALICYMLFAGASLSWAYNFDASMKAFVLHCCVLVCILLPFCFPIDTGRMISRLMLACAFALFVNVYVVLTTPASPLGHFGLYDHKQELGIVVGLSILIGLGEVIRGKFGLKVLALLLLCAAAFLLVESKSKGALLFVMTSPILAFGVLILSKLSRLSPAVIIASVPVIFTALSINTQDFVSRQSHRFYGDYSITGRTEIWQFISYQIDKKPWFGWGFHSYWGVPNSPHDEAVGFVREMVSSHSGYLELRLETGIIGYMIFILFVYLSFRGLGVIRRSSFTYAWVLLTLGLYVLQLNLSESMWMALAPAWILFLLVAAEAQRSLMVSSVPLSEPNRLQHRFAGPRFGAAGEMRQDPDPDAATGRLLRAGRAR